MFLEAARNAHGSGASPTLHLRGHTDTTGTDRGNRSLREQRARAVQAALYRLPDAPRDLGRIAIDSTD